LIITEFELRANWHKTKDKVITLPAGSVITPSARDFIRSKGIQVQIEGDGVYDLTKNTFANAEHTRNLKEQFEKHESKTLNPKQKPEHMTHLYGGNLVSKKHPIIAYRGQLDLFQTECVETQVFFQEQGELELVQKLEEITAMLRDLMVAEVREQPFEFNGLFGLSPDDIRERSHHPQKYYGIPHTPLSYTHGPIVAKLQYLRSRIRVVELFANQAFCNDQGECSRPDIVLVLNRLSSVFYILACEVRSKEAMGNSKKENKKTEHPKCSSEKDRDKYIVPIGISNRHVHLSEEDLNVLFGYGYNLTKQKDLSQPGQFSAIEGVTVVGPKGTLENVRVLGPTRGKTQVELSVTDCFAIGVPPVVRDSGDHKGTPGCILSGPAGNIEIENGVIVASRHIHLHTQDAEELQLKDGDKVKVQVLSQRPVIFDDVLIRVSPNYQKEMHLDRDEGNAALIGTGGKGLILEGDYE